MSEVVKTRKKLIEVALPLEAINIASAREKSIRHGHPSTLHLWWARRPLAAARAVIFAQMVDDPSSVPDLFPTEKAQEKERKRLFKIIEELVQWANTNNEQVLQAARDEIWQSWRRACADNADHPRAKELFDRHKLPAFHDPFAGGGAIPLEAQRLGLEAYASDLNPVAVLINKAMIEIPPRFAGMPPVNAEAHQQMEQMGKVWHGAEGLAADVRYYGKWIRDEVEKCIGHLYPKVEITPEMANDRPDLSPLIGRQLRVVAWLWARTVKSPNPAFADVHVPLTSTFLLCTQTGREAFIEPVLDGRNYRLVVKLGKPADQGAAKNGTKLGRGANFQCVVSGTPIDQQHIRMAFVKKEAGQRLMAIVAEGERGRIFLSPLAAHEQIAREAVPDWQPDVEMNQHSKDLLSGRGYGFKYWHELFTSRQLRVLTTLCDLIPEVRSRIQADAVRAGLGEDNGALREDSISATAYAEAVSTYLAFAMDKVSDRGCSLGRWDPTPTQSGIINAFSRQALPMTWDFAESNPLGDASGNFLGAVELVAKSISSLPAAPHGFANSEDAQLQNLSSGKVVSTDPPYYDNIGYADLSDFFYIWLRSSVGRSFPELFKTVSVPKTAELVAVAYRHGSREKAESFFLEGMTRAMTRLAVQAHPGFPVTIYYAFKQSETETEEGTSSTGWETFLDAVLRAGFTIGGTWPVRTELSNRMISSGTNALASSIVLVCRPKSREMPTATRREFITCLKAELPAAVAHLQRGNIAPVDLAQAAIGPGMAVYTRYGKVLDASGTPLSVRDALALINQTLDEVFAEQEGDFDADTRWAVSWFEQSGFMEGQFGVAEVLSKAKGTSVEGMRDAGILQSKSGKVRLLRPNELPPDWNPATDKRLTVWETVHHLIRVLETGGEGDAAELAAKLGSKAEAARELAYRLYTICERKKRAQEALSYNALVQSWPEIMRLAREGEKGKAQQAGMFGED